MAEAPRRRSTSSSRSAEPKAALNWPPDKLAWARIIKQLPAGVDAELFACAVDAAVQIYARGSTAGDYSYRWRRIAGLAHSKSVVSLCREIEQLKSRARRGLRS